jgi:ribonuclease Z
MKLTFLGTSAGTPSKTRNVSGMALTHQDGRTWIFDCGEGTQHQILRTDIKPAKIERIFITHFHGDHWYGLFGLLTAIKIHGRTEAVQVASPANLQEVVSKVFGMSNSEFPFPLNFVEVDSQPEIETDCGFKIVAVPIKHTVASYGYVVLQPQKKAAFDIDLAKSNGLDKPQYLQQLTNGKNIEKDGVTFKAEDFRGEPTAGLKLVILGDTCDPSAIGNIVDEPDWITHECTYDVDKHEKALQFGHSTTHMAAQSANNLRAKNIILTHFSPRYESGDELSIQDLQVQVEQQITKGSRVHVARDLAVFNLLL